jgi:putative membrane protein
MRITQKLSTLFLLIALSVLGLSACNRGGVQAAREDRPPNATPAEQDFMMKATLAHLSEMDMAQMAMQKSQNSDVRDFANMIQSDHTNALEDLTDLMKDKNVSQPSMLTPEGKADIEKMTGLSGPEFDREFVNMMVADHQKAVEMFRDFVSIAQNPDIKKYAEDLLPKLEMHLEKAQKLQSKLFGGNRQ